jgi:hypothetical protein
MRQAILATVAAVVLGGCGNGTGTMDSGTTDWAPDFVGTWNGTTTTMASGQTTALAGYVVITSPGVNALTIGHACPDGLNTSGPPATVVADRQFNVEAYSCPA